MNYTQTKLEGMMKRREFFNFYLFYGEERFFIKSFLKKIIKSIFAENLVDFNLKTVYNDEFDFKDLEIFVNMPPVLAEKKIFVLKDFSISNLNSSFIEKFKEILESLPEYVILILVVDSDSVSFKKSVAFKKLFKKGAFVEFLYKSEEWLFRTILKSVEKKGFYISPENLKFFIKRVGRSIERLKVELDKIFSFVVKGEIKREDILNLTVKNIEENAFNITKNLLLGKKEEGLEIFNELKREGVSESLIFGAISCCFVDLYRAKIAKQNGVKINNILEFYDYKGKEWRIKNSYLNCDVFSIQRLKRLIVLLSEIDISLKTKSFSKDLFLERFLFFVFLIFL